MPALTKRIETLDSRNPITGMDSAPKICSYEQSREERIRENLQRMQSLGIMDLSLKLKSNGGARRKLSNRSHSGPNTPLTVPSGPVRRSSRLQNTTPVSYSEAVSVKKNGALEDEGFQLEVGSKPEIYTEEHEKLLGNTERSWTFFVDGYGKDGKRIYDPVRGKTCHQCRQKTLGYRTNCCQCNMVQGQFCGDCLYMRYGEHVLEALENENWICPVCRGICNCSLCRTAKGWLPTGAIYRRISKLGFKSVAHYLIQTRRSQDKSEQEQNQASVKRPLSFPATEATSEEPPKDSHDHFGSVELTQDEKHNETEKNLNSAKRSLPFSVAEVAFGEMKEAQVVCLEEKEPNSVVNLVELVQDEKLEKHNETEKNLNSAKQSSPCSSAGASGDNKEAQVANIGEKEWNLVDIANNSDLTKSPAKHRVSVEPNPDSIGARVRQRKEPNSTDILNNNDTPKPPLKRRVSVEPNPDSIGARLRQRRRNSDGI